jgi:hypothetical protein
MPVLHRVGRNSNARIERLRERLVARQWASPWFVVAMVVALAALVAPASAAAGTLDQSQTNFNAALGFGAQRQAAQTFTAGMSGNLDQVDLYLRRVTALPMEPPCNSGSGITVEVRTVSAGVPSNTVLASVNLPASSVPEAFGFVSVPLPVTAVTVGTQYAIVASAPTASCGEFLPYDWGAATGNPYSGGVLLVKLDGGSSWMVQGTTDAAFKTYVGPPEQPPPPVAADSDPPETTITKGAPNKTDKTKLKFKFTSSEPGSTFECRLDKKKFNPCTSPRKVKRLDEGKHKFKVRAIDAAGNVDSTPAKDKFKVVD